MADPARDDSTSTGRLHCGIVLGVREDSCDIVGQGQLSTVRYATPFPTPRTERVSPGHLVAVATALDGTEVVVWRWFDAVVVSSSATFVRLWEPAHGTVVAQPRNAQLLGQAGGRAYLSAGLPGADWWVAGAAVTRAEDAEVELGEVERFCTEHDLWSRLA